MHGTTAPRSPFSGERGASFVLLVQTLCEALGPYDRRVLDIGVTVGWSLLLLVIGALLGAYMTAWLQRTRLDAVGAGSGSTADGRNVIRLQVENRQGYMWPGIKETIVWGHQVWRERPPRWPVQPAVALRCTASLSDRKTGATIAGLWWLDPDDPSRTTNVVDLPAAETRTLCLFLTESSSAPTALYIWAPDPSTGGTQAKPTPDLQRIETSEQLEVRLNYAGTEGVRIPITVTRDLLGRMSWRPRRR